MSDTWQSMCHIAWQRPMHVGHMASHVCDTWHAMSSCMALLKPINMGVPIQFGRTTRFSSWEQQEEGGGMEKRKGGEEKRNGGKERRKGGKEKKIKEEKRKRRGGREEKERGKGRSVAQ